jgi:mitogen-activated protein kinase kinase kinase
MQDYISSLKIPPESVDGGIEIKYTKLLHTMRMRARKLVQFAR